MQDFFLAGSVIFELTSSIFPISLIKWDDGEHTSGVCRSMISNMGTKGIIKEPRRSILYVIQKAKTAPPTAHPLHKPVSFVSYV